MAIPWQEATPWLMFDGSPRALVKRSAGRKTAATRANDGGCNRHPCSGARSAGQHSSDGPHMPLPAPLLRRRRRPHPLRTAPTSQPSTQTLLVRSKRICNKPVSKTLSETQCIKGSAAWFASLPTLSTSTPYTWMAPYTHTCAVLTPLIPTSPVRSNTLLHAVVSAQISNEGELPHISVYNAATAFPSVMPFKSCVTPHLPKG